MVCNYIILENIVSFWIINSVNVGLIEIIENKIRML